MSMMGNCLIFVDGWEGVINTFIIINIIYDKHIRASLECHSTNWT